MKTTNGESLSDRTMAMDALCSYKADALRDAVSLAGATDPQVRSLFQQIAQEHQRMQLEMQQLVERRGWRRIPQATHEAINFVAGQFRPQYAGEYGQGSQNPPQTTRQQLYSTPTGGFTGPVSQPGYTPSHTGQFYPAGAQPATPSEISAGTSGIPGGWTDRGSGQPRSAGRNTDQS